MKLYVSVYIFLSIFTYISCESTCNSHVTCGNCIGHALEPCIWISQDSFTERRCQPKKYLKENPDPTIKSSNVYNQTLKIKIEGKEEFSSTVQFLPKEINIKASPGVTVNFTMRYKPAKDFPVDVYFLMDYSDTMKVHKEALQSQAISIFKGLQNITRSVRLGVGSFVEKPAMPFADTSKFGIHKNKTYAFKNHLSLTDDMETFKNVIHDSTFGGNYDDAEAGLDALMQVMTCKKIDWGNNTRRIIVLATDSTYHSAGDGKMIGAVEPNDMECHMEGNEYNGEKAVTYDYPSVSQIDKVASENKFKIIFAALSTVKYVYEHLAKGITGAKYAELTKESNILDIIEEEYKESVAFVPLDYSVENYNKGNSPLDINLEQTCPSPDHPKIKQVNCKSSPSNPIVNISASIKAKECAPPGTKYTVFISPRDLKEELKIVFEVECECECEKTGIIRTECSDSGFKKCGICICDTGRVGKTCEFSCTKAFGDTDCYWKKTDKDVCNGKGKCRCGKCEDCETYFTGKHCEFDTRSCTNQCSGKGRCKPTGCVCNAGWTHEDCSCMTDIKPCIAPFSSKVCSGRGACECGVCSCHKISGTNETYMGKFCDSCEECAKERCEDFKEYARCNYFEKKKVCDAKFNQTDMKEVNILNKTEFESIFVAPCKTQLDDGNILLFKFDTGYTTLNIQKELEPPPKAAIWVACGSAIGTILLIGLITAIIWKILINMYDKREYEKFCKEAKAQGYDVSENPLYEPPTQSFVNPGFSQNNVD